MNARRKQRGILFAVSIGAVLAGIGLSAGAQVFREPQKPQPAQTRTQSPPAPKRAAENAPRNQFGLSTPKPRVAGTVRIAAYNMLNFFDDVDDPTLSGEFDDIKNVTEPQRCIELARTIREIDADIIGLEEVESLDAIKWLRDTYLKDMGYKYIASFDVGYYRGVECSLMSRYEILDAKVWPDMSLDDVKREGPGWEDVPDKDRHGLKFQRSPLYVKIRVRPDYELNIFVVHHKAGEPFRYHREAEALRIIDLINVVRKDDPSANIIVMGDFNAAPWDKSFRLYEEAGMIDVMAHRIIPHWRNAPQDEARLYKTHESDRVLDYILLNSAAHRELVIGSPFVYGTLTPPDSYDWRKDPKPDGYASDHYPVVIDLTPKDQK